MSATTTTGPTPVRDVPPPRPVPPRTIGARMRWLATDSWTLAKRELVHLVRQPADLIGTLAFPVISVLLFGYVFGSAMSIPGGGDYRAFLMPGLIALTMAFGVANTAMYVVTDTSRGITDRFRAMPVARGAVLSGRAIADLLTTAVDLVMLFAVGAAIGWRPGGGIASALVAIALLFWLRFAITWVGVLVGLAVRSPESAMRSFGLVLPFGMLSNAFVAPELMPSWLGAVAAWNPLSATVAATRELFDAPGVVGGTFVADNALLLAIVWPAVIVAVAAPLAIRRYRDLGR